MSNDTEPVERITVREDIGGPYPEFKSVTLLLYADGAVRWEPASASDTA